MAKRFLVLIALLMLGFFIAGCAEGDKSSSVTNPNPNVFSPTGSISGTVYDFCASLPVKGATVSVAYSGGVHKVVTGADGSFSFSGVPANGEDYSMDSSSGYNVTCDLTTVTGNPYGYATVMPANVYYSDLGDGYNGTDEDSKFTESGSGASTPVNNLASSIVIDVAKPTATIDVTVTDNTAIDVTGTGTTGTGTPIAADTNGVLLFKRLLLNSNGSLYFDTFMGYATAGATTGSYTFTNVVPIDQGLVINSGYFGEFYYVQVIKTGYDVSYNGSEESTGNCIGLKLACQPGCNETVSAAFTVDFAPNKDTTPPVITSVVVPGGPAAASPVPGGGVVYGDVITPTATTVTPFANFVLNFNEAMNQSFTVKGGIRIYDAFTVVLTSAGTGGKSANVSGVDIIDRSSVVSNSELGTDFACTWNTGGTALTLTPALVAASYGDTAKSLSGTTSGWGTGVTITGYVSGAWEIRLSSGASDLLFDLALNLWNPDSGANPAIVYWQNGYVFTSNFSQLGGFGSSEHWFLWVGQGNVKSTYPSQNE
jgi:hypothetical protein